MGVLQTPTRTAVAVTAAGVTIAALNPRRGQLLVYNPAGNEVVYLALGAAAATTDYSVQIPAGFYWELPVSGSGTYIGAISAAVVTGPTTVYVTEVAT